MGKSISERFEEMTKLYHFTSFDAACSIIESRKFRFGKMFKMNDLIESGRIHFRRIITNELPDKDLFAEDEMRRYQQISFIQDRVRDDFEYLGFDLHTMWGLYATGDMALALYSTRISCGWGRVIMLEMWSMITSSRPRMISETKASGGLGQRFGAGGTKSSSGNEKSGSTNKSIG